MTAHPVSEWPEKAKVRALGSQITLEEAISVAAYEHKRAEAALSRLRVAVEALQIIENQCMDRFGTVAEKALEQTGPLPQRMEER